ncbi:MAG: 50S ribosomal protein L9 [Oscillospiraceae bacterium]|nr:50S ribosomal protein L9 [Oscillospiraceae bacterium]
MKVILQKDVKDHGKKGQTVEVSDGYARNYLLPRGLAVAATADALNAIKQQEKARARREELEKAKAAQLRESLSAIIVRVTASAGQGGKLFGSVTSKEISEALEAQHGIVIEKNRIVLPEPIKTFGTYEVKCKLGYEVTGTINVIITEK